MLLPRAFLFIVSGILILLGVVLFALDRFLIPKLLPSQTPKIGSDWITTLIGLVSTAGLVFGVSKIVTDYHDIPDLILAGCVVSQSLFVLAKYEALTRWVMAFSVIFAVGSALFIFGFFGLTF